MSTSKLQILLVFLAIGGSILLFRLPKGIIKKDKETPVSSNTIQQTEAGATPHEPKTSPESSHNIANITKEYNSVLNKEKKVKFADSLIALYRGINQFDSAARWAGQAASLSTTAKSLERAGDAYSEAYALTTQEEKEHLALQSREYYNRVLQLSPDNLEVKSKMALTYVGGNNPMQGVQLLRDVLKKDPKNETAIYNLGVLSLQSGQYEKAINRFKELIDINPANASAHFYLGLCYLNSGDKRKAKIAMESARALESDPAFQATVENYMKELE